MDGQEGVQTYEEGVEGPGGRDRPSSGAGDSKGQDQQEPAQISDLRQKQCEKRDSSAYRGGLSALQSVHVGFSGKRLESSR